MLSPATIDEMTDDTMTDAEMDAILDELERADLVEQYVAEDGNAGGRSHLLGDRAGVRCGGAVAAGIPSCDP